MLFNPRHALSQPELEPGQAQTAHLALSQFAEQAELRHRRSKERVRASVRSAGPPFADRVDVPPANPQTPMAECGTSAECVTTGSANKRDQQLALVIASMEAILQQFAQAKHEHELHALRQTLANSPRPPPQAFSAPSSPRVTEQGGLLRPMHQRRASLPAAHTLVKAEPTPLLGMTMRHPNDPLPQPLEQVSKTTPPSSLLADPHLGAPLHEYHGKVVATQASLHLGLVGLYRIELHERFLLLVDASTLQPRMEIPYITMQRYGLLLL
ncbi:uncharacterized protein MONBRDRAFT_11755 [Monosiga brevicollis MX1]|uniref:Uncharacterized protein n=1 Tax=Monosiga brevicollis TaxID=81824 RepID=A9VA71_MONBE|nr:uncharacterized protein MONBRDRAFT_11755 [Monosiga brevicollis MX1]EDQ85614.1 predicted protein [Monosiga brevicollis MX1]|eukprot:XP_001749563.1 hypothetical protein [Monosiga brevicollis MX1]